jgi:hypothetical protein
MTIPAPTVALSSWTMTQETSPIDDLAELARVLRENSRGPIRPLSDSWPPWVLCRARYWDQTRRLERISKGTRP